MLRAVDQLSPLQQLLFWMLVAVLWLLIMLVAISVAIMISERQKVRLQGNTLDAIRDLFKAMVQVNEYAVKKVTDVGQKAEEVKKAVKEVVSKVSDVPSSLSIPAVDVTKENRP